MQNRPYHKHRRQLSQTVCLSFLPFVLVYAIHFLPECESLIVNSGNETNFPYSFIIIVFDNKISTTIAHCQPGVYYSLKRERSTNRNHEGKKYRTFEVQDINKYTREGKNEL